MSSSRPLVYATLCSLYTLMVVGAYLTVNPGFGLACPDWPLCYGSVVPPLIGPIIVEYTHRLLTILSTLLLFASLVVVWRARPRPKNTFRALVTACLLLVVQIGLGGVVVGSELNAVVTTLHLAVATAIFGALVVAATIIKRETSV